MWHSRPPEDPPPSWQKPSLISILIIGTPPLGTYLTKYLLVRAYELRLFKALTQQYDPPTKQIEKTMATGKVLWVKMLAKTS